MPEKFWERYKTGQKTGKEKDLNVSDGREIFFMNKVAGNAFST